MKNTPIVVLACLCLVLAAFLGGLYLGRNLRGEDIQTSVLSAATVVQGIESTQTASVPSTATATTATTATIAGKININTADLQTLMSLTGIGEVYAQRIIDYREANGPFKSIADITKVEGIGTKRFEAIKNDITVG